MNTEKENAFFRREPPLRIDHLSLQEQIVVLKEKIQRDQISILKSWTPTPAQIARWQ
jgi:hypothetical protein